MSHTSTQQEASSINEANWKTEFEELDRRFEGMPTEAEAKERAQQELVKHNGFVRPIEAEIDRVQATLESPSAAFISLRDKADIQRKIESLEYQLEQAKKARERSIRINGGMIRDAKEWEPKRKRWLELKKRTQEIESAKNIARGRGAQDIAVGLPKRW